LGDLYSSTHSWALPGGEWSASRLGRFNPCGKSLIHVLEHFCV